MENPALSVQILPEAGGGVAGFDWHGRGEPIPLMRRCEHLPDKHGVHIDPNRLSCYPLVPWSNRITEGGFHVDGRWIALARNRDDEPWPIHGSGWQRAWQVQSHTASEARLSLQESSATAYCYTAILHYALHGDALQIDLTVTNTGATAMPFGLGLHPFFPRHGNTRLLAPASQVWTNDGQTPLPIERITVPPHWDFRSERALPDQGVDNAFQAWTGDALIHWPALQLGLQVMADVDAFVLYTPAGGDFFCFEPTDHPINAVHLPGGPMAHGMTMLQPQAVLRRRFVFSVLDMRQG
ncbi:aldose 1-epimerase [Dyella caseinilytica]|uniref:Aldose 1-epimerase n=1 Tax=Dyella caseinilytica TaxID=1849581 RepID=A0ABX7H0G8_9GAMM|nr:aldose 1-epimerase [Dyella caseinilytica]